MIDVVVCVQAALQCDYSKRIQSLTAELDMMRRSLELSRVPQGHAEVDDVACFAPVLEPVHEAAESKRRSVKQRKTSTESKGRKKSSAEVPLSVVDLTGSNSDQENSAETLAAVPKLSTKRSRVSKRKYEHIRMVVPCVRVLILCVMC
jgi:hypothetical protein